MEFFLDAKEDSDNGVPPGSWGQVLDSLGLQEEVVNQQGNCGDVENARKVLKTFKDRHDPKFCVHF